MAQNVSFKWNGKQVTEDVNKAIDRALTLSAIKVQGKAVRLTPVDTGRLRGSITYVVSGGRENFPEGTGQLSLGGGRVVSAPKGQAIIGTVVTYAPYVEFGTRRQQAQAFMLPAFESSIPDIIRYFSSQTKGLKWIN